MCNKVVDSNLILCITCATCQKLDQMQSSYVNGTLHKATKSFVYIVEREGTTKKGRYVLLSSWMQMENVTQQQRQELELCR